MSDYISREALIKAVEGNRYVTDSVKSYVRCTARSIPAADVRPVPEGGIGEMSDGYHTFNGLYYQRMVLFASLVNAHQDKAWKSWKHEDGKPCFDGGWFIVGIDTPQGSYTYHYEDKYWNWFECEELPVAKHWDGHTEEDVTRLMSLDVQPVVRGKWIEYTRVVVPEPYNKWEQAWKCDKCGFDDGFPAYDFCPNCGADMRVSPKLLIYDDTNINIEKKNFTESGKLHTIDKECARRYLEGKIFFGFIIDAFNRIINRINEIEDVINQIRGLNFCPNCGADMRQTGDENV